MNREVRKAVIPAAGLGTRFLPASKSIPKEMIPILNKPTIQYVVEEAVDSGITDILIITSKNKRAIEDHFDSQPELDNKVFGTDKYELLESVKRIQEKVNIYYVRQDKAKGLGHAVSLAEGFVGDEPFAVLLGDDIMDNPEGIPVTKQLIDYYENNEVDYVIGTKEVEMDEISRYGIVEGPFINKRVTRVRKLIEKPEVGATNSTEAIMGRYVLTPDIFNSLKYTELGTGQELQLTDAMMYDNNSIKTRALKYEGTRYDVGTVEGYLKTTIDFALKSDKYRNSINQHISKTRR